ncbi:hypothetical protein ABE459_03980 [Pseudomonas sp. TWI923]|uniref:hypothetical protein n=1 Tax=Pseudomonas sp. TWI923 TaxID=3136794 RepID=UPI00320A71E7
MSTKFFGGAAVWAGASQLDGGYYATLGVQRGEDRSLHAVIRHPSHPTLERAFEAALDAVETVEAVSAENLITLAGGQEIQAN